MLAFEQFSASHLPQIASAPYHQWLDAHGDAIAKFYRTPTDYIVRFPERADFRIAIDTSIVSCVPEYDVPQHVIANLYQNQIEPLIRSRDGELVLHASAICVDSEAIAFVGGSGRGKSTLAAGLARAGYPFLTDDGLAIEQAESAYLAQPSHPNLRLLRDSEAAFVNPPPAAEDGVDWTKAEVSAGADLPHQALPARLRAIYLLGHGKSDQVIAKRLKPAAALMELVKHAFFLDVDDQESLRRHFDRLGDLAEVTPCYALDYPRRYEDFPNVMKSILEHTRAGGVSDRAIG